MLSVFILRRGLETGNVGYLLIYFVRVRLNYFRGGYCTGPPAGVLLGSTEISMSFIRTHGCIGVLLLLSLFHLSFMLSYC